LGWDWGVGVVRLAAIFATVGLLRAQGPACREVKSAIRVVEMGRGSMDPELRTAGAACDAGAKAPEGRVTRQRLFVWIEQAVAGLSARDRYAALPPAAKAALLAGETDRAQAYARELLRMAPSHNGERDYGDAIYDGYSVLGMVALERDNVPLARQYLMNAASTPGSPELSKNGPGMMLAKGLLEKGQAPAVLEFLILCREFWKQDGGRLAAWSDAIRRHEMPDFGTNLEEP